MRRRRYIGACAGVLAGATAGCLSTLEDGAPTAPPTVNDRPDAVYVPSHIEGMQMAGAGTAGELEVMVSYSFPHRFWLVTGTRPELVSIREDDDVHLMATVRDAETGAVVPAGSVSVEATRDGEAVDDRRLWPMLSQNMGLHFGDNVALAGDGTYQLAVTVDPVGARTAGGYVGRFESPVSTTVSFDFAASDLDAVRYERFEGRAGERDAAAPMEMGDTSVATTPRRSALPGTVLGEGTSGDAVLLATALDAVPRGIDGDGRYLAVSPRTPYNRYPLPFMTLSATVTRDGQTVFEDDLPSTFHPDLGVHYGAAVGELLAGDEVTLAVGVAPQIARHEGYETAFIEMPDVALTVP